MATETELLAQKLRDVVEALIAADAALESRIVALEAAGWYVETPRLSFWQWIKLHLGLPIF